MARRAPVNSFGRDGGKGQGKWYGAVQTFVGDPNVLSNILDAQRVLARLRGDGTIGEISCYDAEGQLIEDPDTVAYLRNAIEVSEAQPVLNEP